ncbi:MAG: endonuclease/exonuclease/phosphatase family protein [Bacteroidales bacterium]
MKKTVLSFLLVFSISILAVHCQNIQLITYNLRYENNYDGDNAWRLRKDKIVEMLRFYDVDIIGIQEGLTTQVAYLDSCLPQYHHLGIGRDDGKTQGEYSAIFYKKDKYEVIQSASFWLSETPNAVSKGWDAACIRICTYALFKNKKTHEKFWIFNTHFDHIGEIAQKNSSRLIIEKIKSLNKENLPLVLMGDFNMSPEKEPIQFISSKLKDAKYLYQKEVDKYEGTFNAFEFCKPLILRIDYFFLNKYNVIKYRVLTDSYQCKYLSDHLPVFVELK